MSDAFARRISVTAKDNHDELLKGTNIEWFLDGNAAGSAIGTDGHCEFEVLAAAAIVSVKASYLDPEKGLLSQGPVRLALTQSFWTFKFDVEVHSPWTEFAMKHFPAIIGIVFILLAVALVFIFTHPNPLQTHIVLAMFSLGGGGFGGEIAGFIKTDLTLSQKLQISAGGAAAIFVLLFFFVPAGTPG